MVTNMHPHLLIFGFGYTAHFLAKKAAKMKINVTGTTRNKAHAGYDSDSDSDSTLIHFSEHPIDKALESATHILISTPPMQDFGDPVLKDFKTLLQKHSTTIQWIGYLSSTSVYGDHQGHWVDESSKPNTPGSQGILRLCAEAQWISFAKECQTPLTIFRLAGIYGPQHNILTQIIKGKKECVVKEGQFFSRIHVDDIALVILSAMQKAMMGIDIYNVADDDPAPTEVICDYAASLLQLAPLKKIDYKAAQLSPMAQAFYSHNKRVSNAKVKKECNIALAYPSYKEGLTSLYQNKAY